MSSVDPLIIPFKSKKKSPYILVDRVQTPEKRPPYTAPEYSHTGPHGWQQTNQARQHANETGKQTNQTVKGVGQTVQSPNDIGNENENENHGGTDFSVQDETLGFHQLYPQYTSIKTDAQVDIIAIHGLGQDAYSTWTDKKSNKFWIKDFLPSYLRREDIRVRVLTFGYDSGIFARNVYENIGRLNTFAEQLLNHLADDPNRKNRDGEFRPMLFLCHSLGGLLIKEALNLAFSRSEQYQGINESTKAIIFFGTPHAGTDLANWAHLLGRLSTGLGLNSKSTQDFKTWSPKLMDLATHFVERASHLKLTTFFENRPLGGVIIVDQGSARLGLTNERPAGLDANHLTICQFGAEDEPTAVTVLRRISKVVNEIIMEAAQQKKKISEAAERKEPIVSESEWLTYDPEKGTVVAAM